MLLACCALKQNNTLIPKPLQAQMKQNDTPTKNNGLKIALQYSSDENPFTKTPGRNPE